MAWGYVMRGLDVVVGGREPLGDVGRIRVSKVACEFKTDEHSPAEKEAVNVR